VLVSDIRTQARRTQRNSLPAPLYRFSECLKQGWICHAPIIGKKLYELDDESWGWGHKVFFLNRRKGEAGRKRNSGDFLNKTSLSEAGGHTSRIGRLADTVNGGAERNQN
jgi:hypothetical protein